MFIHNPSTRPARDINHKCKPYTSPFPPSTLLPAHLPPQPPPPTPPAPLLVDPHIVDKPIRVLKNARVLLNVRLAGIRLLLAAALRPDLSRPRPAERGVEHDVHVLEMVVDVAPARIVRQRGAPRARIRAVGRDVRRDRRAGEEPDGDRLAGPFGRVDAAADGVEAGAEVGGVVGQDAAACVFGLFGGVGVAVRGVRIAGHARLLDGAAAGGVECHGVGRGTIDPFDDIDFAHGRP